MKQNNMKKSIIMIIIYCMVLGGLTLSIGALYPGKSNDGVAETINKESELLISSNEAGDVTDNTASDINTSKSALASTVTMTPIPTPEATATPEPTPLPVYELSVGGYPDIEQFFYDYYVAWNSSDYNILKTMYTDQDNIISLKKLEKETQFIDDIRDHVYYIMRSYEDGTYIIYAYYEIKYVNIKTTLPRLDKFYLVTDTDGKFMIFNSKMDETLKNYFDERDNDTLVSSLIQSTNDKADAALKKDEDLRIYVEALYRR
jgi:hypothetical protein